MTYRIGMAGRSSGNFATVIKAGHPALEGLPHEGFCGWQFRRLMEGGKAVQIEADVPFDPIVDVASSVKCVVRQAALFEYRIGEGRLLVCSFRFAESDPAATWLRTGLWRMRRLTRLSLLAKYRLNNCTPSCLPRSFLARLMRIVRGIRRIPRRVSVPAIWHSRDVVTRRGGARF